MEKNSLSLGFVQWSDQDLLSKFISTKNHKYFDEIYQRYQEILTKIAYNFSQNIEDARDTVQEVFIKFLNYIQKSDDEIKNIKSFLIKIAKNHCVNTEKQKKNYQKKIREYQKKITKYNYTPQFEIEEQTQIIKKQIEKIIPNEQMRASFIDFHFNDLNYKEILANKLKINVSTITHRQFKKELELIRQHISRAKKIIQTHLPSLQEYLE